MLNTQEILDQHLKYFSQRDLNAVLGDYSSDAVLFVPGSSLKGRDAIKPFFETLISEFAKPGKSFSIREQSIDGDYAYILWSAETAEKFIRSCHRHLRCSQWTDRSAIFCGQDHSQGLNLIRAELQYGVL